MATKNLFDQNDDENNPNKSTSLESGLIGSGAATATDGGSAAKGTGWTNLQQYLDTNKGAGNAIADAQLAGVNQEIGTTNTAINEWANKASENVNKGIKQDVWSDKVKGKSADEINKNFGGEQAQAFDAWKNLQSYTGPQTATADTGYQDAFGKSKGTQDKIDSANTYEGQQQLSKDVFGKDNNRYSTGMGALDTFVGRADAGNKYDQFKTNNANFSDTFKNNVSTVNTKIGGAAAIGDANKKSAMDAISLRLKELQDGGVTAAQQKQAADIAGQRDYLKGITAPNGQKMTDEQISSMVNSGTYDASDMYSDADLSAINTLAGLDDNDSTGTINRAGTRANAGVNGSALDKWLADNPTPAAPATPSDQGNGGSDIATKTVDILANPSGAAGDVADAFVNTAAQGTDPVTKAAQDAAEEAARRNGLGRFIPKSPW